MPRIRKASEELGMKSRSEEFKFKGICYDVDAVVFYVCCRHV